MDFYADQHRFLIMRKRDLDEALAYCRSRYLAADVDDRSEIRSYVNELAQRAKIGWSLFSSHSLGHDLVIHLAFHDALLTRDGTLQSIEMPVRILARAIAAWDRGEDYTPEESPDLLGE